MVERALTKIRHLIYVKARYGIWYCRSSTGFCNYIFRISLSFFLGTQLSASFSRYFFLRRRISRGLGGMSSSRVFFFFQAKRKLRRATIDALITACFSLPDVTTWGDPLRDRATETVLPGSFFEMKGLRPYRSFQALRFQGVRLPTRSPTLSYASLFRHHLSEGRFRS